MKYILIISFIIISVSVNAQSTEYDISTRGNWWKKR